MAVTVTQISRTPTKAVFGIEATADADVSTGNIAHGLGRVPGTVALTSLLQVLAGLSLWAVTTIDANNIVLTSSAAVGSGGAGDQVRLEVGLD